MKAVVKKSILTLIEDNIVNFKLIYTLNKIGIEASAYSVNSIYVIFDLLQIEDERKRDTLHYEYGCMLRNKMSIDVVENRTELRKSANQIYEVLKKYSSEKSLGQRD